MDEYVARGNDFDNTAEQFVLDLARSMPSDPERRCTLGQAITEAIETIVTSSSLLNEHVEAIVAERLAAVDQEAIVPAPSPNATLVVELIAVSLVGRQPSAVSLDECAERIAKLIHHDAYFSGVRVDVSVPREIG